MKLTKFIALLLISFYSYGQSDSSKLLLAPAKKDGLWGYINQYGTWVIKPQFIDAKNFNHNLAEIKTFGNGMPPIWFVDKMGEGVIRLNSYNRSQFSEGMLAYKEGEVYGFMDTTGKKVIPAQYDYCSKFSEGLAAVHFKSGKIGFIDKSEKLVLSPKYYSAKDFSEGLAVVSEEQSSHSRKYGCIDKKGTYVIPAIYNWITDFHEGYAFANIGGYYEGGNILEGKWYIIDKKGTKSLASPDTTLGVEISNYSFLLRFENGVAWFPAYERTKVKYGLKNTKGEWVVNPSFEFVNKISEGRAGVFENYRMGFIDIKGQVAVPFIYNNVGDFHNGIAWFKEDQKYGFMDKNGKIIINAQFDDVGDFMVVK